jgi:hypothetical protein
VDARVDRDRYAAARTDAGVREQVIASAMDVEVGLLRRMVRGSAEMTLGQPATMARTRGIPFAELVARVEHVQAPCDEPIE